MNARHTVTRARRAIKRDGYIRLDAVPERQYRLYRRKHWTKPNVVTGVSWSRGRTGAMVQLPDWRSVDVTMRYPVCPCASPPA